jgi:hypothetical protein
MSNHTPGDWKMVVAAPFGPEDYEGITIESPSTGTIICDMAGGLPLVETLGNARLIGKAPEMLKMIKAIIDNRLHCFIVEDDPDDGLFNWTERATELIQEVEKVEPL